MSQSKRVMTLSQFIIDQEEAFPGASGELSQLLRDIELAAKVINREVNKAGLVDILGITGNQNVHGETVKKLDVFAHQELIDSLSLGGECSFLGSEESEDIIRLASTAGRYIVLFDPLDGSSNIDVNVSIGTIFSIYRRESMSHDIAEMRKEAKQPGHRQVAAGYILYGSSTMMVYTTGYGVNGFTLDPSVGEFLLSHPNIRIPQSGTYYSTNQGYYQMLAPKLQQYIKYLQENNEAEGRPYGLRYIGTLVADIHRTLFYGGIFFYPGTSRNPNGKLRLLYECNPMAMIIEQAGGRASDGYHRILSIQPDRLHQRVPFFAGSERDVMKLESFLMNGDKE